MRLVALIASELRISQTLVRGLLQELAKVAIRETKKNGFFSLPGLGRLVIVSRKPRMGRNVQTGEPIKLRALSVVKLRLDKSFVERLEKATPAKYIKAIAENKIALPKTVTHVEPPTIERPEPSPSSKPRQYEVIRIFYATDRESVAGKRLTFSKHRNSSGLLSLGTCDVSIPQTHEMGNVERPSILRLEFRENPSKHLVIQSVTTKTSEEFYKEVSERVGEKKEAFVFIHGFKVAFDDAVYRTAQISYDLQFRGAPILYSWPSNGSLYDYTPDINNNDWTVDHLEAFLKDLVTKSGARVINLVAHSMGNRALTNALKQMSLTRTAGAPEFNQIVLTAPDVDSSIFSTIAARIGVLARRITLYVSKHDLALIASKKKNGSYPRAGDCSTKVVVVAGVDTVDASDVDTNFIGHFYYAENRSVLSDIFNLFDDDKNPKDRFGMRAVKGPPPYWRFAP